MTENYPPAPMPPPWDDPRPAQPTGEAPRGGADVVKDQAADLGQSGVQAGKHVVGVAQEQASNVAAEAGRQGKDVLRQAQEQLGQQAAQGQQRLATELLSLGDELSSMAEGSDQKGVAADLARQAAFRARDAGHWLGDRNPAQVIDDVQSFARRRPGVFLALAVGAGLVAGRLTRGLAASTSDDDKDAAALPGSQPEPSGRWAQPAMDAQYQRETTVVAAGEDGSAVPVTDGLPASGGGQMWDIARPGGEHGALGPDQPSGRLR